MTARVSVDGGGAPAAAGGGGDVIAPSVVEWCEGFAPVKVARGNNDLFEHPAVAERHIFEVEGWKIGLVHEVRPESRPIN